MMSLFLKEKEITETNIILFISTKIKYYLNVFVKSGFFIPILVGLLFVSVFSREKSLKTILAIIIGVHILIWMSSVIQQGCSQRYDISTFNKV